MIGYGKRRFYRYSLASALCFLSAFALYDLQKVDFTNVVFAIVTIVMFVGVALFFKGFMTFADPDKFDRFEQVYPGRQYAPRFYAIALGVFLVIAFLLIWTIITGAPNPQDEGVLAFGLAVIVGCLVIGRSSQNV